MGLLPVLHPGPHRTQIQTWMRLAGQHVLAIYEPSSDVTWNEADPTYLLEAARRGW
jgi:hypothetical protein